MFIELDEDIKNMYLNLRSSAFFYKVYVNSEIIEAEFKLIN